MLCAAGLLSNLPDAVLCAELASPGTETATHADTIAANTAQPRTVAGSALGASPTRSWLLLTDGILSECCAAMSAGADSGTVFSHVHQLKTMTVCLGRIAHALQVRCRHHAAGSLKVLSSWLPACTEFE